MAMSKSDRNFGLGGRRGAAVRAMGCMLRDHPLHMCRGPVVAAHARARGMGGVKGDSGDLFNVCQGAHDEAGEYGTTRRSSFAMKYEMAPVMRAAACKAIMDESFGPEPCWKCDGIGGHSPMCPTMEALRERRENER